MSNIEVASHDNSLEQIKSLVLRPEIGPHFLKHDCVCKSCIRNQLFIYFCQVFRVIIESPVYAGFLSFHIQFPLRIFLFYRLFIHLYFTFRKVLSKPILIQHHCLSPHVIAYSPYSFLAFRKINFWNV